MNAPSSMNGCVNAFTNMNAQLNILMIEFLTMGSILADSKDCIPIIKADSLQ